MDFNEPLNQALGALVSPEKLLSVNEKVVYVIVILQVRGMYSICCSEARRREEAQGLSGINAEHPKCT